MEKACWNCMGGQGDTEGVGCADCRYGNQPSNWRSGPNYVPGTNADRIRAMSDEELAEWLCSLMTAECCDQRCLARDICNLGDNGLVKWMKQTEEED